MRQLLLYCSLLLYFSTDLFGQPTISWSQKQLTRRAFPGTLITEQVSFNTTAPASNVQLTIVPELRAFVRVSPSSFSTILPETNYVVNITVEVPLVTSVPMTIQGTI